MGKFAPETLTSWTVDRPPRDAELWIELYGHRAVLGNFPGSKLYLLLQSAIQAAGGRAGRQVQGSLVPLSLSPPVLCALPNEPVSSRFRRYRMQSGIIFGRLRFHVVKGLRFVYEPRRGRQHPKAIAS
jgi:hypothetical protein